MSSGRFFSVLGPGEHRFGGNVGQERWRYWRSFSALLLPGVPIFHRSSYKSLLLPFQEVRFSHFNLSTVTGHRVIGTVFSLSVTDTK